MQNPQAWSDWRYGIEPAAPKYVKETQMITTQVSEPHLD